MKQVLYVADLVGIEHVALGVDFFPTDGPWTRLVHATGTPELKWAIEDLSQMPLVTGALLDAGLGEDDIAKVLGVSLAAYWEMQLWTNVVCIYEKHLYKC